jgi:type VI secretion system secreted protein VgrG
MPAEYKQGTRPMAVSTPLGPDKLLLVGFEGTEQISGLFSFRLDLLAANSNSKDIKFDALLGQELVVEMRIQNEDPQSSEPKCRYFRGICRRFEQGNRDDDFTSYRAEIVPPFWLTTRIARSRIFQQMSVPDIIKKVLTGLEVDYQLQGTFEKREYCVQYRETDFNFACRLMEEEGIFFFFKHTKDAHKMVVANSAAVHPDVPGIAKVQWDVDEGKNRELHHIHEWVKRQEVRSGKFSLWDHSFQRPDDNFESKKNTLGSVAVGTVTHKLQVGGNDKFEIYDYPGEFAQRFDGIDHGGGVQAAELGKISPDGTRTVELRMQAETVAGLVIEGSSNCNQFTSGHKFTLEKHFDAEGRYILTSVHHIAHGGNAYRTGGDDEFVYSNSFTCIPDALPFRPQRMTPKPCVMGAQTAVVVGPSGEEIFTDKYGRIKVQFPWDREGKHDANSSCWLRVGTPWAGKGWGAISIPRIGQEVIVQFMEGDPDAPIVIGSVYNADVMPAFPLPDKKVISGLKSNTYKGSGYNEMTMDDTAGKEKIVIHGQYDMNTTVEHDQTDIVHNNRTTTVDVNDTESIGSNQTVKVGANQSITVGSNQSTTVGSNQTNKIGANQTSEVASNHKLTVGANSEVSVGAADKLTVAATQTISVGASRTVSVSATDSLSAATIKISASGTLEIVAASIKISAGAGVIEIGPSGISMSGPVVDVKGGTIKHNA